MEPTLRLEATAASQVEPQCRTALHTMATHTVGDGARSARVLVQKWKGSNPGMPKDPLVQCRLDSGQQRRPTSTQEQVVILYGC